jgi:hypothetical protein
VRLMASWLLQISVEVGMSIWNFGCSIHLQFTVASCRIPLPIGLTCVLAALLNFLNSHRLGGVCG